MKVWLVGSSGMLAHAVRDRLSSLGVPWVGTDLELDITDRTRVREFAEKERFGVIVNCAAFTAVDDAEAKEPRALAINAQGPENLAEAARAIGAALLHYSTDYVFDGRGEVPYREEDPTRPLGAYGRTKLEGERRVLAVPADGWPGAYIVRTQWLFGPCGKNFVRTILERMRTMPRLKVVADQRGRPTYTVDLAHASLGLLGLGDPRIGGRAPRREPAPSGIYHFANAVETTWHGFTVEILHQAQGLGLPLAVEAVDAVTTAEFPRPAPRPAYSVLSTERIEQTLGFLPRPFAETLADYLPILRSEIVESVQN